MHWTRGETLGAGGFGFVSIAKTHGASPNIPAVVAVKSAKLSQSESLSKEKKLLTEFNSCPCILRCFGDQVTTENGEQLYNILLEYAPGGSLDAAGVLPETAISHHARSLVTALAHIHRLGYVHCDVKPHNVLLVGEHAKLADFGSCVRIHGEASAAKEVEFRGTVMYAAPESVARGEYSPESDVWGLGCTVLHMLTGKSPWKFCGGATAKDVLMRIGCGSEIPAIPAGKRVSEEARDFLRKCFVSDPRGRWNAESLLHHPFLNMTERSHHHSSLKLQSFLPNCFHVMKATAVVHACSS